VARGGPFRATTVPGGIRSLDVGGPPAGHVGGDAYHRPLMAILLAGPLPRPIPIARSVDQLGAATPGDEAPKNGRSHPGPGNVAGFVPANLSLIRKDVE
jgi:hypothetical protein